MRTQISGLEKIGKKESEMLEKELSLEDVKTACNQNGQALVLVETDSGIYPLCVKRAGLGSPRRNEPKEFVLVAERAGNNMDCPELEKFPSVIFDDFGSVQMVEEVFGVLAMCRNACYLRGRNIRKIFLSKIGKNLSEKKAVPYFCR